MAEGLTLENTPEGFEWLPKDDSGRLLTRIEVQFHPQGRAYSYAWGGDEKLQVGDVVRTPRPYRWQGFRTDIGTVVRLGSGYEGPVLTLTELVHRAGKV